MKKQCYADIPYTDEMCMAIMTTVFVDNPDLADHLVFGPFRDSIVAEDWIEKHRNQFTSIWPRRNVRLLWHIRGMKCSNIPDDVTYGLPE